MKITRLTKIRKVKIKNTLATLNNSSICFEELNGLNMKVPIHCLDCKNEVFDVKITQEDTQKFDLDVRLRCKNCGRKDIFKCEKVQHFFVGENYVNLVLN